MLSEPDALLARELEESLLALDRAHAEAVLATLPRDDGHLLAVERLLSSALEDIGTKWETGGIALSQVYMAGRICEDLIASLQAGEVAAPPQRHRVGLAVLHDRHTLGKTMVRSALRANGIPFIDYGHGLEPDDLAEQVSRDDIEVLLVSVLMLNSALRTRHLVDALARRGCGCKIVVGGAPFRLDPALWQEVGAHATGAAASDAPRLVRQILGDTP